MFEITGEWEQPVNYLFLLITAVIAIHGLRYRNAEGEMDFVRLLFGSIAATFFFLVLFQDVLKVTTFG